MPVGLFFGGGIGLRCEKIDRSSSSCQASIRGVVDESQALRKNLGPLLQRMYTDIRSAIEYDWSGDLRKAADGIIQGGDQGEEEDQGGPRAEEEEAVDRNARDAEIVNSTKFGGMNGVVTAAGERIRSAIKRALLPEFSVTETGPCLRYNDTKDNWELGGMDLIHSAYPQIVLPLIKQRSFLEEWKQKWVHNGSPEDMVSAINSQIGSDVVDGLLLSNFNTGGAKSCHSDISVADRSSGKRSGTDIYACAGYMRRLRKEGSSVGFIVGGMVSFGLPFGKSVTNLGGTISPEKANIHFLGGAQLAYDGKAPAINHKLATKTGFNLGFSLILGFETGIARVYFTNSISAVRRKVSFIPDVAAMNGYKNVDSAIVVNSDQLVPGWTITRADATNLKEKSFNRHGKTMLHYSFGGGVMLSLSSRLVLMLEASYLFPRTLHFDVGGSQDLTGREYATCPDLWRFGGKHQSKISSVNFVLRLVAFPWG